MRTATIFSLLCLLTLGLQSRADDKVDIKALLKKAIDAHGGAEKLKKFKATEQTAEGTVEVMGLEMKYASKTYHQLPNKVKNEMTMTVMNNEISVVTVMSGKKGWISINGMTQEMPEEMLKASNHEMEVLQISQLTPLLDGTYKLSPIGEDKVNGKPAFGITVSKKGMKDVSMYFDKKTNLLVKLDFTTKDFNAGGQEISQSMIFSDYKKGKSGLPQPGNMVIERDGKKFLSAKITEAVSKEKLDDSIFEKP